MNWARYRELIAAAGREVSVLNLFGYTGGATLACAAPAPGCAMWMPAGAWWPGRATTPPKAALPGGPSAGCDDCAKFVAREQRRGTKYDAIIMDPPSYGRGPGGEVWKLEDAIDGLLSLRRRAERTPLFVAVNSYTTGLAPSVME